MTNSSDPAWLIEQVCGAGVDPEFDQLIAALAHITRRKPKSLVDTIMYWRKEKVHDSQNAKIEVNTVQIAATYFNSILILPRLLRPTLYREHSQDGTQKLCTRTWV